MLSFIQSFKLVEINSKTENAYSIKLLYFTPKKNNEGTYKE